MSLEQLDLFSVDEEEVDLIPYDPNQPILKSIDGQEANEHGVFRREQGELFRWSDKRRNTVELALLQLENGFWINSVSINFFQCGFSFGLSSKGASYKSRSGALMSARKMITTFIDREDLKCFQNPIMKFLGGVY